MRLTAQPYLPAMAALGCVLLAFLAGPTEALAHGITLGDKGFNKYRNVPAHSAPSVPCP